MEILNNGFHAFPLTRTLAFLFTIMHVFQFTISNTLKSRLSHKDGIIAELLEDNMR